ncbi:MAG: BatD family protein, partial [Polyangiales bacterium]
MLACALAAALWLVLTPTRAAADAHLDVRTDRTSLSLDDTLTLQITVQSQGADAPQIQIPQLDGFQVVSQQVQRPMQFSFGFGSQAVVQASTIYIFGLQPLRAGTIVIKPVRVEQGGRTQSSAPITITVTSGSTGQGQGRPGQPQSSEPNASQPDRSAEAAAGGEVDPVAFVRTVVDKPEPYEGEQVTITIYLYLRERLQTTPNVETEPTTDGLWIQDLLPPGHNLQPGRQVVGNALYTVYALKRVAGFPLRSGDITIGPMSLVIDTSSLFDIFAPDRARPNLKRASQPVVLHVKPLPEAARPAGDVAVGRFTLVTKLDRTQAVTGDAVTLTAIVQGQGNLRSV